MDFKTMTIEQITEWCVENGQVEWLKKTAKKTRKVKGTNKVRKITFFEIKKEFCTKFMPEIIPQKQPKAPTMFDMIDAL